MKLLKYIQSLLQRKEAPKQAQRQQPLEKQSLKKQVSKAPTTSPKQQPPKKQYPQKQVSKSPVKTAITPNSKALTGKLKYFNKSKGYGFIESKSVQERIFFHISDLQRQVKVGTMVEFQLITNRKGYQAKKVKKLRKSSAVNS